MFHSTAHDLLERLARGHAVVIGRGAAGDSLVRNLQARFALNGAAIPRHDSHDAPLGDLDYIIASQVVDEIRNVLLARGVSPHRIFPTSVLFEVPQPELDGDPSAADRWRLRPPPPERARALFHHFIAADDDRRALHWLDEYLRATGPQWVFASELALMLAQHPHLARRPRLFDALCDQMAALIRCRRSQVARQDPTRALRLVFPSAGRCGGNSIAHALQVAVVVPWRVGHEAHGQDLYALLRICLQTRRHEPLVVLLDSLLTQHDAVGGNPFGLILPHVGDLPCHAIVALLVERDEDALVRSILLHNFHYGPHDFVPNRITATDYGEMAARDWNGLARSDKVRWYVRKTASETQAGLAHASAVEVCRIEALEDGLRRALAHFEIRPTAPVLRCNAIPYYREFSPEELQIIFAHFQRREVDALTPHALEALLAAHRSGAPHPDV
jgi:hypothetical protein